MIEKPKQTESFAEKKEFSFENGVEEILKKIESLLDTKDLVVVAVAGPANADVNVGKTTVTGKIEWSCRGKNIPVISMNSENSIDANTKQQLKRHGKNDKSKKGVIILGAMSSPSSFVEREKIDMYRSYMNKSVDFVSKAAGLPVSGIDLRVFVYRPDRIHSTVGDREHADIIIRNDKAKDK